MSAVKALAAELTADEPATEIEWDDAPMFDRPAPIFDRSALHGIAGEYVSIVEPLTEAHPAGILVTLLARFGAAVGRAPSMLINATEHHARIWPCLVGETASRKGTASDLGNLPFDGVDLDLQTQSGLSSGEGLIYAVRGSDEEEAACTVDPLRRRLFVEEPEFASVLAQTVRQGNTLSAKMRAAWDGKKLSTMTKAPVMVDGAHIVLVAHITPEELRRNLNQTELANGFANRFLFVYVARTKLLPRPPPLPKHEIRAISERLRALIVEGRGHRLVERDAPADRLWDREYAAISEERTGLVGKVTTRSAPQVMRIALVYALLDGSERIHAEHLEAALALWRYCEATAEWVWGEMSGDPIADRVLAELRKRGEMLRSELIDLFGRHVKGDRLDASLAILRDRRLVRRGQRNGKGRPAEVWGVVR